MAKEEHTSKNGTLFLAGTILSCPTPSCGYGLYTVTLDTTTSDLVMDDGTLLSPLNDSILPRSAWAPLVCQFCCADLYKDGQVHTFQYGWA